MKRPIVISVLLILLLFSVTAFAGKIGDTNADGMVDLKDVTVLRRALAGGYDVAVDSDTGDTNHDGVVDLKDVTTLRRFLAGGYGVELETPLYYVITGTESYGDKTEGTDSINIKPINGGEAITVRLEDIGMTEYVGKTDDLIDLHIAMVERDQKLVFYKFKGSFEDGKRVTADSNSISVDGTIYTAETVPSGFFSNLDGTPSEINIFNDDGTVTAEFRSITEAEHNTRVIDLDGDEKIDRIVIAPKIVYTEGYQRTINKVSYYFLYRFDDKSVEIMLPSADLPVSNSKIYVASIFNDTIYVETVEYREDYGIKIDSVNNKFTFSDKRTATYNTMELLGTSSVNIDTGLLGNTRIAGYYIYNDEIILVEPAIAAYDYVVLRDVFYDNGYYANVLTVEGMLTLPLSQSDGESLYSQYKAIGTGSEIKYNYGIISKYCKDGDYYKLDLDCFPAGYNDEQCVKIDKGAVMSYNADVEMYIISDTPKIRSRDYTKIFIVTGKNKDKLTLCNYNQWDTSVKTASTAYLIEEYNRHTLLCVVLEESPILGPDYHTDGLQIYLAYKDSTTTKVDGQNYNKYYFIGGLPLKAKSVVDLGLTYSAVNNYGASVGGLYAYEKKQLKHVQITRTSQVQSLRYFTLSYVSAEDGMLEGDTSLIKIGKNVTIWGLSDSNDCSKIKTLTMSELEKMLKGVNDSNKKNNTDESISVILIYTVDNNNIKKLVYVIAEIYDFDADGNATSVNDIIFRKYNGK